MRSFRARWFLVLLILPGVAFSSNVKQPEKLCGSNFSRLFINGHVQTTHTIRASATKLADASYHLFPDLSPVSGRKPTSGSGGIKEIVPAEFRERFRKWKAELLATKFGRQQWEYYANNKDFTLKIVVSPDRKFGAGTDDYEWSDDGKLVAATITLGKDLDKGYPDPVYYPVMNALATYNSYYEIPGNILASTKIIHEFGHVNSTKQVNSKLFQRQNKLMAAYNRIFLSNGYDTSDPRLVDIAKQLGGKPIEIWEDREYWSEVSAMRYLLERISNESFYCSVFSRMSRNINNYASNYRDRFEKISHDSNAAECRN